jgi:hypothetical protein
MTSCLCDIWLFFFRKIIQIYLLDTLAIHHHKFNHLNTPLSWTWSTVDRTHIQPPIHDPWTESTACARTICNLAPPLLPNKTPFRWVTDNSSAIPVIYKLIFYAEISWRGREGGDWSSREERQLGLDVCMWRTREMKSAPNWDMGPREMKAKK